MISWEYATFGYSMQRAEAGHDEYRITAFLGVAGSKSHKFYEERVDASNFTRLKYLALFGAEGWELISVVVDRVTYPGTTIGLKENNRMAGEHSARYTFKRPLQRQLTDYERSAADRFFRSGKL